MHLLNAVKTVFENSAFWLKEPSLIMIKYQIHLAYDGSCYRGWQRQNNVLGVQQVLEESISKVLGTDTTVLGCGRTDAEVHASQYFVQFTVKNEIRNDFDIVLNRVLPADIKVYDVIEVALDYNVQHDAKWRTYRYYIHTEHNPFVAKYSSYYRLRSFNENLVAAALNLLPIFNDYHSFCKTPDRHVHTIVTIEKASLKVAKNLYCFEFKGNRFLKGMVRSLVYDLLQLAENRLELSVFEKKLMQPAFYPNIQLAYPQGLYLAKVEYEKLIIRKREEPLWYMINAKHT